MIAVDDIYHASIKYSTVVFCNRLSVENFGRAYH